MKAYMKWIWFAVLAVCFLACDDDEKVTTKTENVKVSFGTPEMRVYENVSPQRIAIVLSQAAEQDVRVTVAVKSEDGAKEGEDYRLLNPEVVIAKGAAGGYVEMEIQDYFDVKADRRVVLEIVEVEGAAMSEDLLTCSINIVSNEGLPLVAFEEALTSVGEESGEATFAVTLSRPYDVDVTVQVAAEDGTAVQGVHYQLLQNEVTIPAGDTVAYVGVALMDDLDVNGPRIFTLRLTGAENAQVSTLMYMLQVSVTSDDNQVYVSFDSIAVSRYESSGSVDLKVRLSVAAPQEVKVWIAVDEESSTAVEGTDYTLEEDALELAFAPGEMEKTFTVGLIDNSVVDANKVLAFDIDSVENAEPLEGMAECALTITNDDMDFVQLYDDLMGNWTLTTDTKVYTATISGGSSLAEENVNYLNRLMLTVDNTGNAGTAMTLYIDYDVNTGAMSVVLPQLIKENLTVSFWEGQVYQTADHYLFYRNSGGGYVDEEITIQLDWNLDYTNCSWDLNGGDLSCQLCPVGTMDRTAWGIYDFRWASMTMTKN